MKPTRPFLAALLLASMGALSAADAPAKRPLLLANYYCWYHDGTTIQNVRMHHLWHLLAIGPKSATYKHTPDDPTRWTEIFSPDLDYTVRNVRISGGRIRDSQTDSPIEQVVKVIELKPNPDYPKTTPKGGKGKGIWIH